MLRRWRGLRCSIDHYQAGDEDVEVAVVEGSDFAEDVASDEDECCPWEETSYFPALVSYALPYMDGH